MQPSRTPRPARTHRIVSALVIVVAVVVTAYAFFAGRSLSRAHPEIKLDAAPFVGMWRWRIGPRLLLGVTIAALAVWMLPIAADRVRTRWLVLCSAVTSAAFAFMLSTMMDNSAGAIMGAVGLYIVTSILGAIESIGPIRYGFPTFYNGAWSNLFTGASFGVSASRSGQLGAGEEEVGFDRGVLVGIGRVNRVPALRLGVQLTNGTFSGLGRVGGADDFAERGNGVGAFQHERHARTAGHELHELAVKRAALVDGVELAGLRDRHVQHAGRLDGESFFFE